MATKQNQGLQAIVITLSILVILLGVFLVMVNNAKKTAQARADNAEKSQGEARTAASSAQSEANSFKQWMGFGEADNFDTLQTSYQEDMTRFGSTFEEANRSYRIILESIYKENQTAALNEAAAKQNAKDLKEQLLALKAEMQEQQKKYEQAINTLKQEAASQKNQLSNEYNRVVKEKEQISSQLAERRAELDSLETKSDARIKELQDQLDKLATANENLIGERVPADPFSQPSDGKIVWVNQGERKVWINLGSDDGIRPQVTFSVYGADENDALSAATKGSIEVTRILNSRMAEARITSDTITRPLMGGDQIYSQVWSPGRQVGFGIIGFIDLDGDGSEDLDKLKRIIATNGGKVDTAPDTGGELNVKTRFLIAGEDPSGQAEESYFSHWTAKSTDAASLGIEVIQLEDFLELMGWIEHEGTTGIGASARPEDMVVKPLTNVQTGTLNNPQDVFRRRVPPPRY